MAVLDIDRGWKAIRKEMENAKGAYTKIGIQEDAKPQGTTPMVVIAAAQEFGTENNRPPERSWLRSSHDENREALTTLLRAEWVSILQGKSTPARSLGLVGEWFQAKVKAKIRSGIAPPLSEATIKRRRGPDASHEGDREIIPLIDTAQFIESIRHAEGKDGKGLERE